jgi:hypothetical protein
MALEQVGASVVVIAHQFNPSLMSEVWLTRHDLLRTEDREPGCVFTDALVNVRSAKYNLLLTPDQLQFAPLVDAAEQRDLVLNEVGRIVDLLPHVPYHAVGLNFVWGYDPAPAEISAATRRLFFGEGRSFFRHFDTPDAQFGSYLSKDTLGCRLKLDIKPVIRASIDPRNVHVGPAVHLAFNFHLDVLADTNPPARIRELLGQWNEARAEAERIAHDAEDA